MQNQISLRGFLQRRAECLDQMMRQAPDQPDRIREQNGSAVRKFERTRSDIERSKELVLGQDTGIRQHIEHRGFSCIRIADNRSRQDAVLFAAAAEKYAVLLHFAQSMLQRRNPCADMSAVGFELCLTGAACPDAAAEPRKCRTDAGQAREPVAVLRKRDLNLAFRSPRPARKDIKNQHGAVNDLAVCQVRDITHLHAGQLGIKNQHFDFERLNQFRVTERTTSHSAVSASSASSSMEIFAS